MPLTHNTESKSKALQTRVTRHTDESGEPATYLLYLRSGVGTGSRVNVEVFCDREGLGSIGKAIADMLRDTSEGDGKTYLFTCNTCGNSYRTLMVARCLRDGCDGRMVMQVQVQDTDVCESKGSANCENCASVMICSEAVTS